MENASKALIMAGGVLLALLIITLCVYLYSSMTSLADTQDKKQAEKQLFAFNSEYEAYNKNRMYGTDVITVVNKAINHNRNMDAKEAEDVYYINVVITTKTDFETTFTIIDHTKPSSDPNYERTNLSFDGLNSEDKKELKENDIDVTEGFRMGQGTYELGTFYDYNKLIMNDGIIKFFEGNKNDDIIKSKEKTYYIYSALTNFKREIFSCTGMEYNENTGRIETLKFAQVETN